MYSTSSIVAKRIKRHRELAPIIYVPPLSLDELAQFQFFRRDARGREREISRAEDFRPVIQENRPETPYAAISPERDRLASVRPFADDLRRRLASVTSTAARRVASRRPVAVSGLRRRSRDDPRARIDARVSASLCSRDGRRVHHRRRILHAEHARGWTRPAVKRRGPPPVARVENSDVVFGSDAKARSRVNRDSAAREREKKGGKKKEETKEIRSETTSRRITLEDSG